MRGMAQAAGPTATALMATESDAAQLKVRLQAVVLLSRLLLVLLCWFPLRWWLCVSTQVCEVCWPYVGQQCHYQVC